MQLVMHMSLTPEDVIKQTEKEVEKLKALFLKYLKEFAPNGYEIILEDEE